MLVGVSERNKFLFRRSRRFRRRRLNGQICLWFS
jgi:hypothetical protein